MQTPEWAVGIDPSVPSLARAYDYHLGGMHNFEVDRRFAERCLEVWPGLRNSLRENRAFLRRAVQYLGDAGITQFLDIGSGIPTVGNVHAIAQAQNPSARVVYVDADPIVVAHSNAILGANDSAVAISGDFNDIDSIRTHPETTRLIDFREPVAVLLVALVHFVDDEHRPADTIARIRDFVAPGSFLALSHITDEHAPDVIERQRKLTSETRETATLRPLPDIARFFAGFELIEPGLVYLPLWRPDLPEDVGERPEDTRCYAGIGVKG